MKRDNRVGSEGDELLLETKSRNLVQRSIFQCIYILQRRLLRSLDFSLYLFYASSDESLLRQKTSVQS